MLSNEKIRDISHKPEVFWNIVNNELAVDTTVDGHEKVKVGIKVKVGDAQIEEVTAHVNSCLAIKIVHQLTQKPTVHLNTKPILYSNEIKDELQGQGHLLGVVP